MFQITVTQTLPNGQVDAQILTKKNQNKLKIQALPNAKLIVNVMADESLASAKGKASGGAGRIKRIGNHLMIEANDEIIMEVSDFYVTEGNSIPEITWSQATPTSVADTDVAGSQTQTSLASPSSDISLADGSTSVSASSSIASPSSVTAAGAVGEAAPLVGLGFSGISAGLALLAGGLAVRGGGGDLAATAIAPNERVISVTLTAGPQTDSGAGTTMALYKADGTLLGNMTYDATSGQYKYTDTSNYTGVLIVKMVDTDTALDYIDEATGEGKNFGQGTVLMSVAAIGTGSNAVALSINPLTTIAAMKLGISAQATDAVLALTTPLTALDVLNTNKAIAKAFNILDASGAPVDISTQAVTTVIDGTGQLVNAAITGTDAASAYGRALAVISQAERASGQTTTQLVTQLVTALDTTQGALTSTTDTATTTAVQTAIIKGIAAAQASGQVTQEQAAIVVKALAAAPIGMVVAGTADNYLNASETTIDLVISGTFAAGQTLELFNGATPINFQVGAAAAASSYSVASAATSITVTVLKSALTDNADNSLKAKLTQGSSSVTGTVETNLLTIVVDTTVLTLDASFTDSSNGLAGNNTDAITNTAAITAPTNAETGAKVEYRVTKGTGASVVVGNWSTNYTAPKADGTADDDYKVEVRQTDLAGNVSSVQTINFKLDSTKPVVPDAQLTTDSTNGVSGNDSDGITNSGAITAPVVAGGGTGTIEAGAKVEYRITKGTGSPGAWSTTYTAPAIDDNYKVEVRQTDKAGNVGDVQTINFRLDSTAPTITTASLSAAENGTAVASVAGTDASAITWTIDGSGADDSQFSITSAGVLSFVSPKNFEAPDDVGGTAHDGVYVVKVKATDAAGNAATKDVSVTLTNVNEAPTVANAIGQQSFVVGGAVDSFVVPANTFADVDAATTLSYSATLADGTALPAWLSFTPATRTFSGNPTASGSITVRVTASDGSLSAYTDFTLNAVTAPVVQSFTVSDGTAANGASLGKSGEALTFVVALSEAVTSTSTLTAHFSVNGVDVTATAAAVTGASTITFTGATVPGTGNGSTISLTSLVADSGAITGDTSHQPMVVPTAAAVSYSGYTVDNTAPTISTTSFTVNENTASDTALKTITLAATDASAVSWSTAITGADAAKFSLSTAGVLSFVGQTNFEAKDDTDADGVYNINVTATDAAGNSSMQALSVTLQNVNEAPIYSATATNTPPVSGDHDYLTIARGVDVTGATINLAPDFTDPDGSAATTGITYSLASGTLPTGLTLNANGTITGNTTATGDATIHVRVTDGGVTGDIAAKFVDHDYVLHFVDAPALSTALTSAVTNLDVRSKIVFSVGETVTANAGGTITLTDLSATGFRGDTTTHTQIIDITDTSKVQIVGTGANTKIIVDPQWDLDLSSNYSLAVSTGAFHGVGSGQDSVAFTTVNFSTVTPGLAGYTGDVTTAVSSSIMNEDGTLTANNIHWLDIEGVGNIANANPTAMSLSVKDYMLVMRDMQEAPTNPDTGEMVALGTTSFIKLNDIGAGDRVYLDDQTNVIANINDLFYAAIGDNGDGTATWYIDGTDTSGGASQIVLNFVDITPGINSVADWTAKVHAASSVVISG